MFQRESTFKDLSNLNLTAVRWIALTLGMILICLVANPAHGACNSDNSLGRNSGIVKYNIASLYEAFPAPVAHRLARRLKIYYTPRNGSWLNVAETELSVLSRQCLDRRISSKEELKREIETWQKERNQTASTVIWTFTTSDARVKLKHLYPVFEEEESGESIAPN